MAKSALDTLTIIAEILHSNIDKELQLQQLKLFLYVAKANRKMKKKPSSQDIAEALNMPQGSVSRNTKVMGIWVDGHGTKRGMDLIKSEPDIYERRRLVYSLTEHGENVFQQLASALGEK